QSRFQDGEPCGARGVARDRAGFYRGDATGFAADGALGCRRTRHIVLPDDGSITFGAAILLHVVVLPDRDPGAPGRLRSACDGQGRDLGPAGAVWRFYAAVATAVPDR